MMNSITRIMLAATAGLFCATVAAADFDGSEPLMCSLGQIIECDYGAECHAVTNESIDAPDFVRLDFRRKQVSAITAGEAVGIVIAPSCPCLVHGHASEFGCP